MELFQNGFSPEHDHYQMVAEEDRYKFEHPELDYCSLFDDVQELKKLADDTERACSIVECRRRLRCYWKLMTDQLGSTGS